MNPLKSYLWAGSLLLSAAAGSAATYYYLKQGPAPVRAQETKRFQEFERIEIPLPVQTPIIPEKETQRLRDEFDRQDLGGVEIVDGEPVVRFPIPLAEFDLPLNADKALVSLEEDGRVSLTTTIDASRTRENRLRAAISAFQVSGPGEDDFVAYRATGGFRLTKKWWLVGEVGSWDGESYTAVGVSYRIR